MDSHCIIAPIRFTRRYLAQVKRGMALGNSIVPESVTTTAKRASGFTEGSGSTRVFSEKILSISTSTIDAEKPGPVTI
ncbi:hypothetical protein N7497_003719 [Penicillium chrysogenum]|jgi:hypothetical protein|nr:hypothetical protein N7497_003719 [Penicillium chrysogenum]